MRFPNTPGPVRRTALALALGTIAGGTGPLLGPALQAQPTPATATPLLDALSITVRRDSTTMARGTLRFRQVRTGADVELVASGIVVQKGLRVTAELRTDSAYQLRRYVTETRDSANRVVDRILVSSSGGRITLERTTPTRRSVREFLAQRDLMILDSLAMVPFLALAGLTARTTAVPFLDVRRSVVTSVTLAAGLAVELPVADVAVTGFPVRADGLPGGLRWWRDARGHLLRIAWAGGGQVLRDDPPT